MQSLGAIIQNGDQRAVLYRSTNLHVGRASEETVIIEALASNIEN